MTEDKAWREEVQARVFDFIKKGVTVIAESDDGNFECHDFRESALCCIVPDGHASHTNIVVRGENDILLVLSCAVNVAWFFDKSNPLVWYAEKFVSPNGKTFNTKKIMLWGDAHEIIMAEYGKHNESQKEVLRANADLIRADVKKELDEFFNF